MINALARHKSLASMLVVMVLAFLNLVVYPTGTFALSSTQKEYIDSGIYYFDEKGLTCQDSGGGLVGGNNVEIAFNYLVGKGLTEEQAAGVVGNLIVESIGVNPTQQQIGGGPGRGIAQWEVGGRWDTLLQFASIQKLDPLDLGTQLDFLWWEFTGEPEVPGLTGGYERAAYDHLKATTTVAEAAASFMTKFERPKDQSPEAQAERAAVAQPVYDEFATGAPATGGTSTSGESSSGCSSEGGTINIDGFFFPLITTKSDLDAGAPNDAGQVLVWSHTCQTNCHHDYDAADIHAMPGTIVVAAKPGLVRSASDRLGGGGSSITIMGDDGVLYYYTHMTYNSLLVAEGDTVTGGQRLGEVGVPSQAMNTASHLHFDALPGDQYQYRPSCSSAECSGYPFINVSPILSELYEGLPE